MLAMHDQSIEFLGSSVQCHCFIALHQASGHLHRLSVQADAPPSDPIYDL